MCLLCPEGVILQDRLAQTVRVAHQRLGGIVQDAVFQRRYNVEQTPNATKYTLTSSLLVSVSSFFDVKLVVTLCFTERFRLRL